MRLRALVLAGIASGCGLKGPWVDTEMCIEVEPDAEECPAAEDVDKDAMTNFSWCDADVRHVNGGGELQPGMWDTGSMYCCYSAEARDAEPNCVIGRPLSGDGPGCLAPVHGVPETADPARDAWLAMARAEHASVAAFARLTLQLMALGAPPALLAKVQRAAADEVRHTQLCLEQAERLAGVRLRLGAQPLPDAPVALDAVGVAVATVREGCLGETLGAHIARCAADASADPHVAAILGRIAQDEARHAALSWEIVAWLLPRAGVRDAVVAALRAPFPVSLPHLDPGSPPPDLDAWIADAVAQVLEPAAVALLAA